MSKARQPVLTGNRIHPTAIIEGPVSLGRGNVIGEYAVLRGPLEVGNNNIIGPHVCIGMPGQDTRNPRYDSGECRIRIGSNNIIREFSAVHKPCYRDVTCIGDDVFVMSNSVVNHDAIIEDKVVVTSMVALSGIVRILEGANIGTGAAVHQFGVIGPYAMVAMGANAAKNVRPFALWIPGRPLKVNVYAVDKFGFGDVLGEIRDYVYQRRRPADPRLLRLVERYETHHGQSGRAEYE